MGSYKPRPRCGAPARSTGKPCKRGSGAGTSHPGAGLCSNHGGSSPDGEKYAQRLQAEETAQRWGLPVVTTATDALSAELARTFGRVLFLAARVETLGEADLGASPWPGMERWERRHLADVASRWSAWISTGAGSA